MEMSCLKNSIYILLLKSWLINFQLELHLFDKSKEVLLFLVKVYYL